MENRQHQNDMEKAKPSREEMEARYRAEYCYGTQSEYIDAIDLYLGFEVDPGPVTYTDNGTDYTFDFYDPECAQHFKIFKSFDEKTHRLYADCPCKPVLIYDCPELPLVLSDHESDEELVLLVDSKASQAMYQDKLAFFFYGTKLWMYGGYPDGDAVWRKMVPYLTFWNHLKMYNAF